MGLSFPRRLTHQQFPSANLISQISPLPENLAVQLMSLENSIYPSLQDLTQLFSLCSASGSQASLSSLGPGSLEFPCVSSESKVVLVGGSNILDESTKGFFLAPGTNDDQKLTLIPVPLHCVLPLFSYVFCQFRVDAIEIIYIVHRASTLES